VSSASAGGGGPPTVVVAVPSSDERGIVVDELRQQVSANLAVAGNKWLCACCIWAGDV
jgi:hypothetical protein